MENAINEYVYNMFLIFVLNGFTISEAAKTTISVASYKAPTMSMRQALVEPAWAIYDALLNGATMEDIENAANAFSNYRIN